MLRTAFFNQARSQRKLAQYLAARRQQSLQANTPLRFLQTLGLVRQAASPPRGQTRRFLRGYLAEALAESLAVLPLEFPMDASNGEMVEVIAPSRLDQASSETLWEAVALRADAGNADESPQVLRPAINQAEEPTTIAAPVQRLAEVLPPEVISLPPLEQTVAPALDLELTPANLSPQTAKAFDEGRAVQNAAPSLLPEEAATQSDEQSVSVPKTSAEERQFASPFISESAPGPFRDAIAEPLSLASESAADPVRKTGAEPLSSATVAAPPHRRRARIEEFPREVVSETVQREIPPDVSAAPPQNFPTPAAADAVPGMVENEASAVAPSVEPQPREDPEALAAAEPPEPPPLYWYQRLVEAAKREAQGTAPTKQAALRPASEPATPPTSLPVRRQAVPTRTAFSDPSSRRASESAAVPVTTPAPAPHTTLPPPRRFVAPRSTAPTDATATLSAATRQLLQPLLGIDPALVPIYQDEAVGEVLAANNADAVTDGEAIAIKPEYKAESPEFLGVLAHELTHVVRQRQPRFIPPIARTTQKPGAPAVELMEEEAMAQRVESRVRQHAQTSLRRTLQGEPGSDAARPEKPITFAPAPTFSSTDETVPAAVQNWGGLPAPWEPMPDWSQAVTSFETASLAAPAAHPTAPSPMATSSPAPGSLSGSAPLQFAAEGRSWEETADAATGSPAEAVPQPQPDLDQLARQVYSVLKRRLAAERRREFFE